MDSKRQRFLQAFLGALGAVEIQWTTITEGSVSGTVVYDPSDPNERQDFTWTMTEKDAPGDEMLSLIAFLVEHNLLDGDRIIVPVSQITVPGIDEETKIELFGKLFSIKVNMVCEGTITDWYFVHQ